MLKTYLYIPDHLEEKIVRAAKTRNRSKAEVLRQAIENGLQMEEKKASSGVEVLFKLAELGKKYKLQGPKDSSERIDELLWGIKPE